jgi:hypothetical protein
MKKSQSISAALVLVTWSCGQAGQLGKQTIKCPTSKGTELETKVIHCTKSLAHLYDSADPFSLRTAIESDSAGVVLAYALLSTQQKSLRQIPR